MWISERMAAAGQPTVVSLGRITASESPAVSVQAELEYRNIPVCSPWGIAYLPPVGEQAVLVQGERGAMLVGVPMPAAELQPGELLLFSAGGASICLKNSGEVVINGQVFLKQGDA